MARVLVVDDEVDAVELFTEFLKDEYEVVSAGSGKEALEKISPEVDLVLLDRMLPDIHGDEVLKRIREDMEMDIPVVLVTALDADVDVIDLPFTDYIRKPVSRDELKEKVRSALSIKDYDSLIKESFRLINKRDTLRSMVEEEKLHECEEYHELESDIRVMQERVGEHLSELLDSAPSSDTKEFEELLKKIIG